MGGAGIVYAAYDTELGRTVALKVLRPGRDDQLRVARLSREARAMARLCHPNIVRVFDVGASDGRPFVAMELVDGGTMRQWLARERPSVSRIVSAFICAARGLAAAHRVGLLHRDFKLDNVLVRSSGEVLVSDFGLVASLTDTEVHAAAGEGTPSTMAPEQHDGRPLSAATDQYALCVALFEALWEQSPFRVEGAGGLRQAKRRGALIDVERGRVSRRVWSAIRRGLEPEPDRRFASMAALIDALAPARRGRSWMAAGLGLAIVAVATSAGGTLGEEAPADPCADVHDDLVWGAAQRDSVERAWSSTDAPFAADSRRHVDAVLTDYSRTWARLRRGVCRAADHPAAARGLSPLVTAQCLSRARLRVEALGDVLASADGATAEHAARAAESLPDPRDCWTAAGLPWGSTVVEGEHFERALAEAEASHLAGRLDDALARADEAVTMALLHGEGSALARARLAHGRALVELVRYDEANDELERAYFDAVEVADDLTALQAGVELLRVATSHEPDLEAAHQWSQATESRRTRLGVGGETRATLLYAQAELAGRLGQPDRWLALHREALALRRAARPEPSLAVAASLEGVGRARLAGGDVKGSLRAFEHSLWMRLQLLGTEHPAIAVARNNLGIALARSGQQDGARAQLQEALRVHEATRGPNHPRVGRVLANLGAFALGRDERERARHHLSRAARVLEVALGPSHPQTARVRLSLASTLDRLGEGAVALTEIHRLLDDLEPSTLRPVELAWVQLGLAQIELHHGRSEVAAAALAQARALGGPDTRMGTLRQEIELMSMALLVRQGRISAAAARGRRALAAAQSPVVVELLALQSRLEAYGGRGHAALELARRARARLPPWFDPRGVAIRRSQEWISALENQDAAAAARGALGIVSTRDGTTPRMIVGG